MPKASAWPRPSASERISAIVGDNRLVLVESGADRLQVLLDLIDGAADSIRLLFYMFHGDAAGAAVRDALVAAAARGVHVRLLLDGFGCGNADPAFFAPLRAEGGVVCLFHPRYGRRYLVRNHQKLAIADDRRALIGGANIHEEYLTDDGPRHWRDLWLAIDGPAVPAAGEYFDSIYHWSRRPAAKLRQLRRIIHRHTQFRGPVQWKFTAPLAARNPWRSAVGHEIRRARSLDIIAAYFSPPGAILRRIRQVAGRGRVQIITAAKSDNVATIAAARHTYAGLLRRGVEMYEYRPARLHTKLLIADDTVHIGSANFDFRSFYINLEIMLRVDDAAFAARMRAYFARELEQCERITPALHRQRASLWRRFRWTVSHFLVTTMDYTVTRRLNFGPEA